MTAACIIFVATGLLFVGLGLPLALRRVKPNYLYGLRVPETLADATVWYEANAVAGRDMVAAGGATVVAAVGLYLVPGFNEDLYAVIMVILLVFGALAMCLRGVSTARRLAATRRTDG